MPPPMPPTRSGKVREAVPVFARGRVSTWTPTPPSAAPTENVPTLVATSVQKRPAYPMESNQSISPQKLRRAKNSTVATMQEIPRRI